MEQLLQVRQNADSMTWHKKNLRKSQEIHITPKVLQCPNKISQNSNISPIRSRHGVKRTTNSPVKIHEETEEVEAEFDHGFFHVRLQLPSIVYFCWIKYSHVTTGHHNVPGKLKDVHTLERKSNHQHKHWKISNQ